MDLQTVIPLSPQQHHPISYGSKLLMLGSCFSENIGNTLAYFKFQVIQNPFGILFHPKAIELLLCNAINQKKYTEEDLFYVQERWHCFDAHSKFSTANKEALLTALHSAIETTHTYLKQSTHVVITLGTAWVYRFIEKDQIVANCHKVPQKKFLKEILSINAITESLDAIVSLIRSVNPTSTIIFTVSPVRHIKDGFIENQRSKSHLLSAIHEIIEERKNIHYFPSYEIMMDELRDYRFYAKDMIHPNETAIAYIWNKFHQMWMEKNTLHIMQEVDQIQRSLQHRPFNPNSEAHQLFLQKLERKKEALQKKYPTISF